MNYDGKQFLKWLQRKPFVFEYDDWHEHYSEMIDALYAKFRGWS